MTEEKKYYERYIVDDCGSIIDVETREFYDYPEDVCDKKNGRQNYNELLRIVHPFYHKLKNVRIYKINRKHNKIADKLAKKALKGDYNV